MNTCSAVNCGQIDEMAVEEVHYIIENSAIVRQVANAFGILKSTIHMV
ncbi:MAG: sporulation transcriptional regulator SpoIIID [Lachnospiraceae bacterium]|nr:sporulation transcriptional regulator SpoIIID [Lachnospiraceae bacterium]